MVSNEPSARSTPVGNGEHVVESGDCVASIAFAHGHFWQKVWDHERNAELKQVRQDPNVLLPGDRVHVPDLEQRIEAGPTNARHRFRRKGVPSMLRLQLKELGEPLANEPYRLTIDGQLHTGRTDEDGKLEMPLDPSAESAVLLLGTSPNEREYRFQLGGLDPIDTVRGVQQRLKTRGFFAGEANGEPDDATTEALREFQAAAELEPTGELDDATRKALQSTE